MWKDDKIGSTTSTIHGVGSLLTCFSMVLNKKDQQVNGQTVTPKTLNEFLGKNNGYIGNELKWDWQSKFGLKRSLIKKPLDKRQIADFTCQGKVVILHLDEKYVLATGFDAKTNTFSVNDPTSETKSINEALVIGAVVYN